jgi:beta-mannosidase
MPHSRIDLNGNDWQVLPLMPREWEWRRVWEKPRETCPSLWIPAVVPGTVQDDAQAAGLIPDYTHDFNSRACEWTSERDWMYLKEFPTPDLPADGVVRLRFEGVDYACHVFLNGQRVGDHEGMYDAFEFDVTGLLVTEGMNKLVVVVEHAPREVGQIGRTSEVRLWKARFAYDWDWCTRLVPIGIFDHVSLEVTGPAHLRDVQVTASLAEDFGAADVDVVVGIDATRRTKVWVRTEVGVPGADPQVHEGRVMAGTSGALHTCRVRVTKPRLWWPNGYGEQGLYQATVSLRTEDGACLDERTVPFGIRRVRAVPNEGAPEGALPYVLEVNGQRVFLKGWNWAPISQLYGRNMADRYHRWLLLARDAHCNLLRVWGGGLLEKEVFYRLCDQYGIMVWQEFIQSSSGIDNRPSTKPEYVRYIRHQATKMIPRRRNHPSLVIWCGGNELMDDSWHPLDDSHPALAVLKETVQQLDPGRLWLPTSASGPVANASLDQVGRMHDVHGPWQYQGPEDHYRLYNGIDPLLHSEFGVEGAANLEAMREANTEALLWPPDTTNPLWMHKGSWWIQREMMRRVFGEIDDLETYIRASQFLQAEGLRYAIESNRRRKWHCAGTSPWQFNESWPNLSCTNVVDYYGQPRPAYWWCRRAYEPLHPSAKYDKLGWRSGETFSAELWAHNSLPQARECMLAVELMDLRGNRLVETEQEVEVPPACALPVGSVSWPVTDLRDGIFILRLMLVWGRGRWAFRNALCDLERNDYVFSTAAEPVFAPLLRAPRTEVTLRKPWANARSTEYGEPVLVRNAGDACALFAWLQGPGQRWMSFGDNYLVVPPGSSVGATCLNWRVPVRVSGWNFDEQTA